MSLEIEFYLEVFEKISEFYEEGKGEILISEKIAGLMDELSQKYDLKRVRNALIVVLRSFDPL